MVWPLNDHQPLCVANISTERFWKDLFCQNLFCCPRSDPKHKYWQPGWHIKGPVDPLTQFTEIAPHRTTLALAAEEPPGHTSLKLLIHSLWLVLENPASKGSGLRDAHKLCQHSALSRADLTLVYYEQRVTEVFLMFLREVADSTASRSNEKAHLSQRQDPPLPSNRADLLYGANIHLFFCCPCLLCYSCWVEQKSKESHPAQLIPTGTGG